ncbi:MAG TPA: BTAD domain-containing putative transcriptional regulator [Gemmatimonadales bacterium]|jgi:TolB-like protein/DNA-binding SARP family transcriptional activator/Tfp pilus assembly protein PilF
MIEFRLLGALHLTDAEGREVQSLLTRPRRLALLAYLAAATPRGFHRRDSLLALFWPELDQEHGRAALRQALHVVRDTLGADVIVTRGDEEVGLDLERIRCDVVAFDEAVAAGEFGAALDCYRGPLLQGFFISDAAEFERWLEIERARLAQAAGRSARRLLDQRAAEGDVAGAAELAQHAAQLGPHDEGLLRRRIGLLDQLGDRASAVAAYEEFAQRLAADLETEPSAETKAVLAAVQTRETAAPIASPSPARNGAPRTTAPASLPRGPRPWWRAGMAAVVTGLVLSNAGRWRGQLWPSGVAARVRSLAVLPLENLSADTLRSWYADGLTEALTTDLGRIRSLSVTARGSVTPFGKRSEPLAEIARELHVDAVVEGGVQQAGDQVRVDVRLISAATGYQLWADRFEEPVQNRFALEDRVAHGIVSALELPLSTSEERALRAIPTKNLEAYDDYLRGKIRLRRENREDDSIAIMRLQRAVRLDPDFAAAQAELARAYVLRVEQFVPRDTALVERAWLASEKALRLAPELAEAHFARGALLSSLSGRLSPEPAVREYHRAVELNPNLAQAHHGLGTIYLHLGLLDRAVDEFRRTLAIDPGNYGATRRIGLALVSQGRYEDGLRLIRQVPPQSNQSLWSYQVAWVLLYLGRNEEAATLIERYLREHPEDRGGVVTSTRAVLFAKMGDGVRAEKDVRTAIQMGRGYVHFHHTAYNIATVYALLRQPARAVYWLRQAADGGWPCYPYFARDPNLENIHGDPGFVAFMRQLKTQWERYAATL